MGITYIPWSNGESHVMAKHVGYGWGKLYKNTDKKTWCLVKGERRYRVRDSSEIIEWGIGVPSHIH